VLSWCVWESVPAHLCHLQTEAHSCYLMASHKLSWWHKLTVNYSQHYYHQCDEDNYSMEDWQPDHLYYVLLRSIHTKWSIPWFDCDESLTWQDLNLNPGYLGLFYFSFTFVSLGESCLLIPSCAGGRCDITCSDEDHDRSSRHGAANRRWSYRSGTQDRAIERSGDTVCGLLRAHRHEERRFLSWALKPRSTIYQWFDLKTLGRFLIGLCLKTDDDGLWVVWHQNHKKYFRWFGIKTSGAGFLQFGLKIGGVDFV
jgi:hypothetical protein